MTNTTLKTFAPGIMSFLVVLLGAVQPLVSSGAITFVLGLQLAVLVATSVITFLVPLTPKGWQGALKTGFEIVGVAATAIIPFVVNGHISHEQILLVGVAVLKALATEFGVQIRTSLTGADTVATADDDTDADGGPVYALQPGEVLTTPADPAPVAPAPTA